MWKSSGTSNVEGLEDWKTHLHPLPPCTHFGSGWCCAWDSANLVQSDARKSVGWQDDGRVWPDSDSGGEISKKVLSPTRMAKRTEYIVDGMV